MEATTDMFNLFATSGHINYAKSARLYVQQMRALHETHPWLHHSFINGSHAVRRSARNWAKQALMGFLSCTVESVETVPIS